MQENINKVIVSIYLTILTFMKSQLQVYMNFFPPNFEISCDFSYNSELTSCH